MKATERRAQGNKPTTTSPSQRAQWILAYYSKYPAAQNQDAAKRLLEVAVNLFTYDIVFLTDDDCNELARI